MTAPTTIRIVAMDPEHAAEVLNNYRLGIDEGNATFETAPTWDHFNATKLPDHRHVAVDQDDTVLGWVAAVPVSDRCAYAGVVEHSVYVHPHARSRGIGTALLSALIASTEAAGIWTIQSGIFPENTSSLALHEKAGFRIIGTRERIGHRSHTTRSNATRHQRAPLALVIGEGASGVGGRVTEAPTAANAAASSSSLTAASASSPDRAPRRRQCA